MSNSSLALIVAIVGVIGTLAGAVLTQLFGIRAQREQRREETWRAVLKERRDSCVALSVEARRIQQMLESCLSDIQNDRTSELEQAWQAFVSNYSAARIILPHTVDLAAADAFGNLLSAYRKVLEASRAKGSPVVMSPAEQEELVHRLQDGSVMIAIRNLRDASRDALGSDQPLTSLKM